VTHDAGETWTKLTEKNGLPAGELGRCGVAFAVNKPNIAYALIEAKKMAFIVLLMAVKPGRWLTAKLIFITVLFITAGCLSIRSTKT
jgi:hypothetical protein